MRRCHLTQDSSGQQDMQEQRTICKTREELIRVGGRLGPSPFPGGTPGSVAAPVDAVCSIHGEASESERASGWE